MFQVKQEIASTPPLGEDAYYHLLPIVEALIADGNEPYLSQEGYFFNGPDGWIGYFKQPLNFDLIREKFELPDTIVLDDKYFNPGRRIFCKASGTEIFGGIPNREQNDKE